MPAIACALLCCRASPRNPVLLSTFLSDSSRLRLYPLFSAISNPLSPHFLSSLSSSSSDDHLRPFAKIRPFLGMEVLRLQFNRFFRVSGLFRPWFLFFCERFSLQFLDFVSLFVSSRWIVFFNIILAIDEFYVKIWFLILIHCKGLHGFSHTREVGKEKEKGLSKST